MLLSRSARVFGIEAAPTLDDLADWQRQSTRASMAGFVLNGGTLQVTGNFFEVLDEAPHTGFVFLGRNVEKLESIDARAVRIGVLARRNNGSRPEEVTAELTSRNGSVVVALALENRMRQLLLTPATIAALMLVFGIAQARIARAGLFLLVNTVLIQCTIAAFFAEQSIRFAISPAGEMIFGFSIAAIGLNLITAALVLAWSLHDHKERCPLCLRRFAMPVRIGSAGSVIFDAAGVESLCPMGHGSRFVPEWTEAPTWMPFDKSWQDAFVRGPSQ